MYTDLERIYATRSRAQIHSSRPSTALWDQSFDGLQLYERRSRKIHRHSSAGERTRRSAYLRRLFEETHRKESGKITSKRNDEHSSKSITLYEHQPSQPT